MAMTSRLPRLFTLARALWSRADASVLPTFALATVPLLGMVGAATDYSRASAIRSGVQRALDAAILAGARDGTANWPGVALAVFQANFVKSGVTLSAPSFIKSDNGSFVGQVSGNVAASFLGVLGISAIPVSAKATAVLGGSSTGHMCVMALSSSAQPALALNGNSSVYINAPNCVLQVNSSSSSAVQLNGNTSITSVDNCITGGVTKVGNAQISPAPRPSCKPVSDVFANYPRPTVGSCDYTNYSASGQSVVTLQPGVYCGGMKFSSQVSVTFAPGLYVIKDGVLEANGGSQFTGLGVTFFLTGQGAAVQVSGQANWRLVAPVSGPFAGFVFFLDKSGPSGPAASSSQISGGGELYFEGVVYLPQQVTVSGGAQMSTPSPYTSYVTDTLTINGNGTLVINSDPKKTAVPIPAALQVLSGGQPRLLM